MLFAYIILPTGFSAPYYTGGNGAAERLNPFRGNQAGYKPSDLAARTASVKRQLSFFPLRMRGSDGARTQRLPLGGYIRALYTFV